MGDMPNPPKRTINSWIRGFQSVWDEHALKFQVHDDWFRVWALALARKQAKGHAPFASGEIAGILGKPNADGVWVPKAPSGVSQAIDLAKRKGLLDASSNSRCLVVPSHWWQGGIGSLTRPCPEHG